MEVGLEGELLEYSTRSWQVEVHGGRIERVGRGDGSLHRRSAFERASACEMMPTADVMVTWCYTIPSTLAVDCSCASFSKCEVERVLSFRSTM